MAWSSDRRRRHAEWARARARATTCPACGRRAALKTVDVGYRVVVYCYWYDQGRCMNGPR